MQDHPSAAHAHDRSRLRVLDRLYVWSVVVEPLLFFILFGRALVGIPGSLSKMLQATVIVGLAFRLLLRLVSSQLLVLRLPNLFSRGYVNLTRYFALLVIAGLIGLVTGTYVLPQMFESAPESSWLYSTINSASVRPFLEYAIAAYYIGYFAILPGYVLTSKAHIAYWLSAFNVTFVISFLVGAVDFAFGAAGIELVPRHISDGIHVGFRFHGLAGEPRQAFVYLFLGLALLHLRAHFRGGHLSRWWLVLIPLAAIGTQSLSGLLGIVAFVGLYGAYYALRLRRVLKTAAVSVIVLAVLYVAATNSARLVGYVESGSDLWAALEERRELPGAWANQFSSIYPLYDLTVKLRDVDILHLLVGSGLGSASVVNNRYAGADVGMSNPNAQFVRVLFESGLLGLLFYVMSFTVPVAHFTRNLPARVQHSFILLVLLLVGCSLGVRSPAPFIYLGIFIAAFRCWSPELPTKVQATAGPPPALLRSVESAT